MQYLCFVKIPLPTQKYYHHTVCFNFKFEFQICTFDLYNKHEYY